LEEFPDVPHVLLDEAVNLAYTTQRAVIKRRKQGLKCEFSFRSRKATKQSFIVQRLSGNGPFPSFLSQHLTEAIPSVAEGKMASVVWESGRWFLICKIEVAIAQAERQGQAVVACDPGVRTFITAFSPVDCVKIGKGFAAKLRPMLMQLDKLYSKRAKFLKSATGKWLQCHRDRFRYFRKHIFSVCNKIHDLKNDLHKRAADFLTKNYDVILLPTFETSNMVAKSNRRISSRTVRQMLSLGHYRFKQFLSWIAYKRGKKVVLCSEAYTSKTDSRTGQLVNVGLSETINKLDRDVNGARGILLRALAT
jgi:putative transposase